MLEEHASNPATPERLRAGGGPPAARRYGRGESMEEQQAAVVLQAHARGSIDRGMLTPRTRQIRRGEGTMKAMEKAALLDDFVNVILNVFLLVVQRRKYYSSIAHHPNAASPHEAHCSVIVTCVAADCGRLFAQLCSTGSSIGSALFGLAPRSSPFGE